MGLSVTDVTIKRSEKWRVISAFAQCGDDLTSLRKEPSSSELLTELASDNPQLRLRAIEDAPNMKAPPAHHWRSYGNDPLPTAAEALDEPFSAFPSWFLRITCDRCGKDRRINEVRRRGMTGRCARSSARCAMTAGRSRR